MSEIVDYSVTGNIAVLSINNPPVNALSHALRQHLIELVHRANNDDAVVAAILICSGKTFIAGADISEFNKPPREPLLPTVVAEIEASGKLIIAALHGTALGGGFEIAMACHYRCALASARIGLPEVNLGLLPGASGSQRLPRLVGVERALEMMISGRQVPAELAHEYGAVDRIVRGELLAGALDYTRELISRHTGPRRLSEMPVDTSGLHKHFFEHYRQELEKQYRGYFSPQKIVDCVEAAVTRPYVEAIKLERELFNQCRASSQSRSLRYLFFAERQVYRVAGIDKETRRRQIQKVAVIGAGTMGGGIAVNFLNAGIPVYLLDRNEVSLDQGVERIGNYLERELEKGRLTNEGLDERLGLLTATLDYSHIGDADLVIESVFEDLKVKQQVFSSLDQVCRPGAVLASNTSTLDIEQIAGNISRPQDVLGMHFFAPAEKMKLLEIIRTSSSGNEVVATAMDLAKRLGKIGVVVGACFGFVGNRMFLPYLREAQLMVLEGLTPGHIDRLACDWGMAMGPFAVMDLSGLDVFYRIYQQIDESPNRYCYFPLARALYNEGRLGRKSGAGFYLYEDGISSDNPELTEISRSEAKKNGIARREISNEEVIERLLFSMVNEGAGILQDGIAQRPSDIDVIFVNGFGFPRYRGGPMCYADSIGLRKVYDRISQFRQYYGETLWPAAILLEELAGTDAGFSDMS